MSRKLREFYFGGTVPIQGCQVGTAGREMLFNRVLDVVARLAFFALKKFLLYKNIYYFLFLGNTFAKFLCQILY